MLLKRYKRRNIRLVSSNCRMAAMGKDWIRMTTWPVTKLIKSETSLTLMTMQRSKALPHNLGLLRVSIMGNLRRYILKTIKVMLVANQCRTLLKEVMKTSFDSIK